MHIPHETYNYEEMLRKKSKASKILKKEKELSFILKREDSTIYIFYPKM